MHPPSHWDGDISTDWVQQEDGGNETSTSADRSVVYTR